MPNFWSLSRRIMKKIVNNYIVELISEVERLIPTSNTTVADGNASLVLGSMHKIEISENSMLVLWVFLGYSWQSVVFDDDFSEEEPKIVAGQIYELIKHLIKS